MSAVLLERLRVGDPTALDEIALRHQRRLQAIACTVVRCPQTAEEVVQDVLFRLWTQRTALGIRGQLDHYLGRAVRNRALDRVRRHRLEARWLERQLHQVDAPRAEEPDAAADAEWDPALREALEALPPRRRDAMMLRWCEGLSYGEIARRLDVSVKTVENQIGRGLRSLREAMGVAPVRG
jgi:RNA polymerase sigma-70 factor, ECF subfamily